MGKDPLLCMIVRIVRAIVKQIRTFGAPVVAVAARPAQCLVAISTEASEATITSTVVNRSSVSHSSRRVSTRP